MAHKELDAVLLDPTTNETWILRRGHDGDCTLACSASDGSLTVAEVHGARDDPFGGIIVHAAREDRRVIIFLARIGTPDSPPEASIGPWLGETPAYWTPNRLLDVGPEVDHLEVEYRSQAGYTMKRAPVI